MEEFINLIKKYCPNINNLNILDIGSRDLGESIIFSNAFPNAKIYAFECNPQTIPICIERSHGYENIKFFDKAVNNYDGICKFYPINKSKTITTWSDGNPGASSLFKSNGRYTLEKYGQDEIEVECVRLDTILKKENTNEVDIIWMDLQGAELLALESLGDYIKNVKIIYTEVEINPMYEGQCLFVDVDNFMKNNNFTLVGGNLDVEWGTDVIYINNNVL